MAEPKKPIATTGKIIKRGDAAVEDYLCITVQSQPGESRDSFKSRLSVLWSKMLREDQDAFEKVFAETVAFEQMNSCLTRQYLVEESALDEVERRMLEAGVDFAPIDRDDKFSKYEAAPPEWMQIEH
jgi:hypothetical protein